MPDTTAVTTAKTGNILNPTNRMEDIILVGAKMRREEQERCLSASVSMSMNQVSQVSMQFYDPGFEILDKGLLVPNARMDLGDAVMRVASVATTDLGSGAEGLNIVARPDAVRRLKNARGDKVMKDVSPSQFVIAECKRLKIKYKVQESQKRKRVARDVKQPGEKYGDKHGGQPPSSWTTFQRLASELGFVCFESFGVLHFGKPKWFVEQYEGDALHVYWNTGPQDKRNPYLPECSRTLDGELKTIQVSVPYKRWKETRPGRAFKLHGIPFFEEGTYIVSEVEYDLVGNDEQIKVTATIPVNPEKQDPVSFGTPKSGGDALWVSSQASGLPSYTAGNSLKALCQWAGFSGANLNIAVAVVMAESKGNAKAVGDVSLADSKWGPSYGLFQIRSLRNPSAYSGVDTLRVASKLLDAQYNVKTAFKIWKQDGWGPWSTYTSGAYKQYLGKDYQIKGWSPPRPGGTGSNLPGTNATLTYGGGRLGDKSASTFVRLALQQAGDNYIYGHEVLLNDPNPNTFDCSELVQWAAARAGVYIPDGSSAQIAFCRGISLTQAIRTRGALLWTSGHIAISLGNGRTIEAANSRVGVVSYSASGRFARGGLIPKMRYGTIIQNNDPRNPKFNDPGV